MTTGNETIDRSTDIDRTIDELARRRLGLVTVPQLLDAGLSEGEIRHRRRGGRLVPVQTGVYRTFGVPPSWWQRVLAACLAAGPGAVASHRAAAVLWDLSSDAATPEITVPVARCPKPANTTLHRSTNLPASHVTVRHRVPVTNPLRTLVDLGAVVADPVLTDAVELAIVRRLVTVGGLRRTLNQLARPGRRGVGPLRQVLDQRALGTERSHSVLESFFARLVADVGLGDVCYQHRVMVAGKVRILDFAIPDALLGIEVDGDKFHGTLPARRADRTRQNSLAAADWLVLRYDAADLRRDPHGVVAEIATLAERRRALLCSLSV